MNDDRTRRLARLRLTMHAGAHPRPVEEGIPFLGFSVFPERRRLKRRKGVHYRRRLRRLARAYANDEISLEQMTSSVQGWVNHVRYGNTVGLRKAMLGQPFPALFTARPCEACCDPKHRSRPGRHVERPALLAPHETALRRVSSIMAAARSET